jgi:hypothetical protein
MTRRPRVDRFEVFSGIAAVIGGLVMFAVGASAGWSSLILGDGILLLAALWLVTHRRRRHRAGRGGPGARGADSTPSTVN